MPFPPRPLDQSAGLWRCLQHLSRIAPESASYLLGLAERVSEVVQRAAQNGEIEGVAVDLSSLLEAEASSVEVLEPTDCGGGPMSDRIFLGSAVVSNISLSQPNFLIACLSASIRLGLSCLPISLLLTTGPQDRLALRSEINQVLTFAGYADASGWPMAGSLRSYYASVADPASRVVLSAIPVASGDLLVGNVRALCDVKPRANLTVSLCRTGIQDLEFAGDHLEMWLNDRGQLILNPRGPTIVRLAAEAVAGRLARGELVFVHCAVGRSRSLAVAAEAISLLESCGEAEAFERVKAHVPSGDPLVFR